MVHHHPRLERRVHLHRGMRVVLVPEGWRHRDGTTVLNHDIDTDLVRFEHDECENADIVSQLCDVIDDLLFQLVTLGFGNA